MYDDDDDYKDDDDDDDYKDGDDDDDYKDGDDDDADAKIAMIMHSDFSNIDKNDYRMNIIC